MRPHTHICLPCRSVSDCPCVTCDAAPTHTKAHYDNVNEIQQNKAKKLKYVLFTSLDGTDFKHTLF